MSLNRRHFLRNSSLALAAMGCPAWLKAAAKPKYLIGIQLYSVREDMAKNPLA
ncbi:MAG: twin-arginine translocation signal domain-containing protein, partial [Sphingobacteriia bacterium]